MTWFINHQIFLLYDILNRTSSFHQPRQHGLVHWSPHSDLFFKLNTDGSPLGNLGPSGFGGVILKELLDPWKEAVNVKFLGEDYQFFTEGKNAGCLEVD